MQHRNSKGFFKYILNYSLIAAAVLAVVIIAGITAQAQSTGYWATDGCFYQAYGNQWYRTECRYYDRSGTLVAQNRNGTFYWYKGRWHNNASYIQAIMQEMARLNSQTRSNNSFVIRGYNAQESGYLNNLNVVVP